MIDTVSIKEFMWESAKEVFETMIFIPVEKTGDQNEQTDSAKLLTCTITFDALSCLS